MTSTRVFIGNVPQCAEEKDVRCFFRGHGRIRRKVVVEADISCAFVWFAKQEDAKRAVKNLTGYKICGEEVVLEISQCDRSYNSSQQPKGVALTKLPDDGTWEQFKMIFGRDYGPEEDKMRRAVFLRNQAIVVQRNAVKPREQCLNNFADWTNAERQGLLKYTGYKV